MKQPSRGAVLLIPLILIASVVLIIGFFIFQNYQTIKTSKTPPSPTSDMSNWKTYTNKQLQFSVNYPDHLSPMEDFNPTYKSVIFFSHGKYSSDQFRVLVENKIFEKQVEFVKMIIAKDVYKFESETNITVQGFSGIRLDYKDIYPDESEDGASRAIIAKDGKVYTIYSSLKTMDQILPTFRFLE